MDEIIESNLSKVNKKLRTSVKKLNEIHAGVDQNVNLKIFLFKHLKNRYNFIIV
jgi:hypothetical protein